ncbi:hypothetical protein [Sphingomonas sp. LHG3406-1]|uniref:hypothetical protein n=1 Tax=Sphingomonas sp. LHG3406-1 TaxID=2804617 RepID=UPI002616EC84|nr:hypothetical protein [Sphingomonas sp. LHG3406-1]
MFFAVVFSRTARIAVALLATVLGAYLVWDNVYTETYVGADLIEVRKADAVLMSDPAISVPVRVKLQIANHAGAELESIDVVVTLLDCSHRVADDCEPVARKAARLQLLAPAGLARRTQAWVYFENVPTIRGTLRAQVRVTGGVLDWS